MYTNLVHIVRAVASLSRHTWSGLGHKGTLFRLCHPGLIVEPTVGLILNLLSITSGPAVVQSVAVPLIQLFSLHFTLDTCKAILYRYF